jgi:hypothetical protein
MRKMLNHSLHCICRRGQIFSKDMSCVYARGRHQAPLHKLFVLRSNQKYFCNCAESRAPGGGMVQVPVCTGM